MALNAPMRFGDAVHSVFVRCSISTSGNHHARFLEIVREFVRTAHTQLFPEAEWTPALARVEIPLTAGLQTYDWPDDCLPGRINFASVRDTEGNEIQLDFGMRPNERSAAQSGGTVRSDTPLLLTFVNGDLELTPAPASKWDTLIIDYVRSANSLADDADPMIVDGELVVQSATMKFKRHLGLPVGREDVAEHERYLDRVKGMQSTGGGFQIGGHQSSRNAVHKRNRIGDSTNSTGSSAPYDTDWSPY